MIKLTDGTNWDKGQAIYAFGRSTFGLKKVDSSMVRDTTSDYDVINCTVQGLCGYLLVRTIVTFFYTVSPRENYICITTTSKAKAHQWMGINNE